MFGESDLTAKPGDYVRHVESGYLCLIDSPAVEVERDGHPVMAYEVIMWTGRMWLDASEYYVTNDADVIWCWSEAHPEPSKPKSQPTKPPPTNEGEQQYRLNRASKPKPSPELKEKSRQRALKAEIARAKAEAIKDQEIEPLPSVAEEFQKALSELVKDPHWQIETKEKLVSIVNRSIWAQMFPEPTLKQPIRKPRDIAAIGIQPEANVDGEDWRPEFLRMREPWMPITDDFAVRQTVAVPVGAQTITDPCKSVRCSDEVPDELAAEPWFLADEEPREKTKITDGLLMAWHKMPMPHPLRDRSRN